MTTSKEESQPSEELSRIPEHMITEEDPLEELLATDDEFDEPSSVTQEGLSKIVQTISEQQKGLTEMTSRLAEIASEMQRLKTDEQIMAQLYQRCEMLNEIHHEREVLRPFLLGLIGLSDRARQQVERLSGTLDKATTQQSKTAVKAVQRLMDARNADRLEVENLLSHYSVEPFRQPGDQFDPATQKCICRIKTPNEHMAGRIAQRLLPGYRRDGRVLRREYVGVFVHHSPSHHLSKGE